MKKWSVVPVALAGFIAGIAFILGSGGGSSSNSAIADVPSEQMICRRSSSIPFPDTILEGCFDSNGNNRSNTTISEVLAEGWRAVDGSFFVWVR